MLKRSASVLHFKPVQRETIIEMVARRIEALVRSGELKRGDRLPSEPRLAELLQVSRASLREALKGMMFLGLLRARAGDGTYLLPSLTSMVSRHFQWMLLLDEIKYLELYELRQILEPAAAALAARRANQEDLENMESALNSMKSFGSDPEQFIVSEMEFHNSIIRASKNAALQSTMSMLYGALSEGRHRTMPLVTDIAQNCAKHERIFRLIAQQDASGARRAVVEDLKYAEALLKTNLAKFDRPATANKGKAKQRAGGATPSTKRKTMKKRS